MIVGLEDSPIGIHWHHPPENAFISYKLQNGAGARTEMYRDTSRFVWENLTYTTTLQHFTTIQLL